MTTRARIIRSFLPAILIALFIIGVTSVAAAQSSNSAAATVQVEICDNCFKPEAITVNVGDTVVWTHNGNAPHDVTANNGAFTSPRRMVKGQTFSWTATAAGAFDYICTIHSGQNGKVTVQAAAAPAAAPAAPASSPAAVPAAAPRTGGGMSAAGPSWLQALAVGLIGLIGLAYVAVDRRLRSQA